MRCSAGAESQHWPQTVAALVVAATAVGMVAAKALVTTGMLRTTMWARAMTMWAMAEASIRPQY